MLGAAAVGLGLVPAGARFAADRAEAAGRAAVATEYLEALSGLSQS